MVYLINQRIIFNEGDGTLAWRDQNRNTISLSAPLARILITLIENPGVTLSRETLLRETLEKHALSPSINNLNNYISLLRKVLREFDLDDAIVTIPKTGISFNVNSIDIFPDPLTFLPSEDTPIVDSSVIDRVDVEKNPIASTMDKSILMNADARKHYAIKIVLVSSIILLFSLIAIVFPNRFPYRPLVKINIPEKCTLYALQSAIRHDSQPAYQELCADNLLFYISKKHMSRKTLTVKPKVLISCTRQGKGCVTYVDY